MKKIYVVALLFCSHFSVIFGQKPPVLTANAIGYNFNLSIEENFNAGRRYEEQNKGLSTNSLGHLVLPTNFATLPLAQRALVLVNAERVCRNGINYGTGNLVVKPFQTVETNLSQVSQAHAEWLVAQNKFDHCGNPALGTGCGGVSSTPSQRIQGNTTLLGGWEKNSENIGLGISNDPNSPTFTLLNEVTIFNMIYRNAPAWVHRDNFLQELTDNFGAVGQEGFLGVGEKKAANYNPLNTAGVTHGGVVVYQIYDAKATATNAFSFYSAARDSMVRDSSKVYKIVAKHNSKVIGLVEPSSATGKAIVQAVFTNLATQKWQFVPTTDGYFQLISQQSGQALDVRWGGTRQGVRINQWAKNTVSKSQEWKLEAASNGAFKIINRNSGLALSVPNASNLENLQLVQLKKADFYSQLWDIVETSN